MHELTFSVFPSENFIDLRLFQFGRERCDPAHSFGPAARNHFLFHYVLSGAGTLMADDGTGETHTYSIGDGQGFMLFPHQISTYIADTDQPWEYAWVEFDGLRVKGMLEQAGLSENAPIYHARTRELREEVKQELLHIAGSGSASSFHLIGHLYLFLDALVRSSAGIKPSGGSTLREFYVREALEYIEQNFQNDITVDGIAEVCGLNRSYFGKIFKEAVGATPQDFLLSFRMAKAAELLKLTPLSVGDIGAAVGYDNSMHFSRAFKNVYGVPPRKWRNQNMQVQQ